MVKKDNGSPQSAKSSALYIGVTTLIKLVELFIMTVVVMMGWFLMVSVVLPSVAVMLIDMAGMTADASIITIIGVYGIPLLFTATLLIIVCVFSARGLWKWLQMMYHRMADSLESRIAARKRD